MIIFYILLYKIMEHTQSRKKSLIQRFTEVYLREGLYIYEMVGLIGRYAHTSKKRVLTPEREVSIDIIYRPSTCMETAWPSLENFHIRPVLQMCSCSSTQNKSLFKE